MALQLSSSGSGSSTSSSESDGGWVPQRPAVQPKPKGRPRKYPAGTTRHQRRLLSRGDCLPVGASGGGAASSSLSTVGMKGDALTQVLRPVGDDAMQLIARLMRSHQDHEIPSQVQDEVAKIVNHFLRIDPGSSASNSISMYALSRDLGIPSRTLGRKVCTLAQAIYCGSRCLASSLLSKYLLLW